MLTIAETKACQGLAAEGEEKWVWSFRATYDMAVKLTFVICARE